MFKAKEKDGLFLGYEGQIDRVYFFFGSRHLTRESLAHHFPKYEFCFLRQVHGTDVHESDPSSTLVGDGHWTNVRGRALVSQTADCIPLLLSGSGHIMALHAGWKGVAQNIIGHSARVPFQPTIAAIGPHILRESFEVGLDVSAQILRSVPLHAHGIDQTNVRTLGIDLPHPDADKRFVDLHRVARLQLQAAFAQSIKIYECLYDTKSDVRFHSFRRDRDKAGRQLSFVVINN